MTAPSSVFTAPGLFFGLALPVFLLLLFTALLIPCFLAMHGGVRVHAVLHATACYLLMGLGIFLMIAGGTPIVFAVLTGLSYPTTSYIALLLLFAVGGALFLWYEQESHRIDAASKAIPLALFLYTLRFTGLLLALYTALSLALSLLLLRAPQNADWWVTPAIFFVIGLLLTWSTGSLQGGKGRFSSMAIGGEKKGKK